MAIGQFANGSETELLSIAEITEHPLPPVYRFAKRTLDVVFSSLFLLVFFPLFLIVGLIVRLTSPGPIFYRSTRIGLCGKPFAFLKFRSMYVDANERRAELEAHNEKDGPIFKMKHDPRITPIGRILRKYSLDEIPQLVHVLLGQMTLVGPRPPLPGEVANYNDRQRRRLSIKPGITCYWQVRGRSNLSFEEWIDLDLLYIEEMCMTTDLATLLQTPRAVIKGHGAY